MTIELKPEHVGRKVKLRCGMLGVIHSYHPTSDRPFRIDLDRTKIWHYSVFYKADGKQWDIETGHDVIEILEEEKDMAIELKVGQKVKTRGGLVGEVVEYFKLGEDDDQPFKAIFGEEEHTCWYTEDGYYYLTKEHDSLDIVEILSEKEEEDMTIKLEVGQKVKTRGGLVGKVSAYYKVDEDDEQPFKVIFNYEEDSCWYTEDGYYFLTKEHDSLDIVEILEESEKEEEEEPMEVKEIKARYFYDGSKLIFIQNVEESTITIVDVWENEIQSVIDYGNPIKAKEQMYTYAKLFEVEEVKTH